MWIYLNHQKINLLGFQTYQYDTYVYKLNQERTITGIAETKKVINKWNIGDKPCIFIHSLSFLQITQLKIDNNPFAKGFRDREKVFPQKRSAPFMDQLREAASSEGKQRRSHSHESEGESSSPDKKDCITPPGTLDSIALYNSTKLDLLRQQIARQQSAMTNPFLSLTLNKLPMMNMNQINLPFNIFPNRT